mgnify:CR=1 FL=1|jgi:hypothetical protein
MIDQESANWGAPGVISRRLKQSETWRITSLRASGPRNWGMIP